VGFGVGHHGELDDRVDDTINGGEVVSWHDGHHRRAAEQRIGPHDAV